MDCRSIDEGSCYSNGIFSFIPDDIFCEKFLLIIDSAMTIEWFAIGIQNDLIPINEIFFPKGFQTRWTTFRIVYSQYDSPYNLYIHENWR